MNGKVLVVDDDEGVRELVVDLLSMNGYETQAVGDAASLIRRFQHPAPDVMLLDLNLPDGDGLDLIPKIKRQWPDTEVIMLTGFASFDAAVEATKRGAYHFLTKPCDTKSLLLQVQRANEHKRLRGQTKALRNVLTSIGGGTPPVFQSPAMRAVVHTVERVASSDVSVLITGESGTGKEVISDLIHSLSPRNAGPLIKVNCAALPRELIESELFGSVKGAFTGALGDREGLFRQAQGGTLLLDEISEMPIDTQSKLLRVLQEKEVRPVGGRSSYKTDCRIIAATNRDVEAAIRDGKLREDLYYRIGAIVIQLPPLRDRREDIVPLANLFLKHYAAQAGRPLTGFTPPALEALVQSDWPGNVRQLQNAVQRAALLAAGPSVEAVDLPIPGPREIAPQQPAEPSLSLMDAMERNTIIQALKETQGNKLEAARRLGIGRQTLYNKIKQYQIEV